MFILNFNLSAMQKIKREFKKTHLKKKILWLPWQQNNLCLTQDMKTDELESQDIEL